MGVVSNIPHNGSYSGPHVVVVGNHKGGSGKSTVAMHIIVALLKEGKRVASVDIDLKQQTLTRYVENRYEWAQQNNLPLEIPEHHAIPEVNTDDPSRDEATKASLFMESLAELQNNNNDYIVIDTPSGEHRLSILAYGMADTLVTPVNDSFIDLDVIVSMKPSTDFSPTPSHYAATVATALQGRRAVTNRPSDWIVIRNRLAPLLSRNQRQIAEVLGLVGPKIGFRTVSGLSERVVFREFFPIGLTAFDPLDESLLGSKPNMSHLAARTEVREMVEALGLIAPVADGQSDKNRLKLRMPRAALLDVVPPPMNDPDPIPMGSPIAS